ncbi:MAG: hypothetical protein L6R43_09790, partial [Planctomycetes bacterium]|nr:hypothetical protein [Planctomycetota bacterium]
ALLPRVRPLPAAGGPGSLLEAAEGEERVREVEPGLFEVEVRIAWPLPGGGRGESRLATLLAGGAR